MKFRSKLFQFLLVSGLAILTFFSPIISHENNGGKIPNNNGVKFPNNNG
ncbi:hypothetical protein [Bacillus cereus group sp. BY2-1LC]|nr:hypothetical protein [Bacillus cereus group sp. BY2-1LC]MDA1824142.1 hypothetical protein [Bacillus cereus group sp. BY2-1LC]